MVHKVTVEGREMDLDKFRLRNFVGKLAELGELEVHEEPVALADLSHVIESSSKAQLFKNVGAEHYEVVAATAGSRKRLAAAFGVEPAKAVSEFARRLETPQPVVTIPSADAPVHQVIKTGDQIDLTKLPFHPQHEFDGGTYISSGIDYSIDPATGRANIGCRRLMLRSKNTMRANLTANSDLKKIYKACVERKEKLPVSFVVGSHPIDFLAAVQRRPGDERNILASLRGEPAPLVKSVTNDVLVPADAEMVIEGYFDELGYREMEGPYGEMWGYYGPMHIDPVFTVTAITHRKDVLFQTVLHSSHILARGDSPNMSALGTELHIWRCLRKAGIEPAAVAMGPGLRLHGRVALKRGKPGEARKAIEALLKETALKHVVVVDDDVDVIAGRRGRMGALHALPRRSRSHPREDAMRAPIWTRPCSRRPRPRSWASTRRRLTGMRRPRRFLAPACAASDRHAALPDRAPGARGAAAVLHASSWRRSAAATAARSPWSSTGCARKACSIAIRMASGRSARRELPRAKFVGH